MANGYIEYASKEYVDEQIQNTSGKFVVTVRRDSTNPENYVADKSSTEIISEYNSGSIVSCIYGTMDIPLVSIIDGGVMFALSTGTTFYNIWITDYDASVTTEYHAHEIEDINGLYEALDNKSNITHTHDDMYYTEAEVDLKLSEINTSIENFQAMPMIHYGTTEPDSSLGKDGDLYIKYTIEETEG